MNKTPFKKMFAWILAGLAALALNLALFGLLPALMRIVPDKPAMAAIQSSVPIPREKARKQARRQQSQQEQAVDQNQTEALAEVPEDPVPEASPDISILMPEINPSLPALPNQVAVANLRTVGVAAPPKPQTVSTPQASASPGPVSDHIFGVGELDGPLVPLGNPSPIYPVKAKRRKIEGTLIAEIIVGLNGTVEDVQVVEYIPKEIAGIFDQSVIRGVSAWRFSPGTERGVPVRTRARVPIEFMLD